MCCRFRSPPPPTLPHPLILYPMCHGKTDGEAPASDWIHAGRIELMNSSSWPWIPLSLEEALQQFPLRMFTWDFGPCCFQLASFRSHVFCHQPCCPSSWIGPSNSTHENGRASSTLISALVHSLCDLCFQTSAHRTRVSTEEGASLLTNTGQTA